jgi:demethylspheroidene O-methyltransferase
VTAPAHGTQDLRVTSRDDAAVGLIDKVYAIRDRLLASPRFQRLAGAFPLTRPIARNQARSAFDLCAGFVYSQILAACVELDVFRRVTGEPKTADRLARELAVPADRLARLMDAAVSLRLLSRRSGGRYGLGTVGASLSSDPGIVAMVAHHAMLYRDLADPVGLLRGAHQNELEKFWGYAGSSDPAALNDDEVAPYSALMAASQSFIAADVLDCYRFGAHRCVMDVGGGEGVFIAAAAAKHPGLTFKLFDLPAVAARAGTRLAAAGLAARVEAFGGSFLDRPLPRGADLISLVRVVHDHDDPAVRRLLRAAYEALPAGGKLLIAEPMAGSAAYSCAGGAYFGMYLLAMGSGRPRTVHELSSMSAAAGFRAARVLPTRQPLLVGALIAEK